MTDLIPEGCVSLKAAFALFQQQLWNGHLPIVELHQRIRYDGLPPEVASAHRKRLACAADLERAEFLKPFVDGELDALVRPPGVTDNYTIPKEEWATAFFPERLFMAAEIADRDAGDYWSELVGRTPFVWRAQLDDWLAIRQSQWGSPRTERSPTRRTLRDYLIGLVMDGALPSAEAEKVALDSGLRGFATRADAIEFDPMREPSWSLAMAVSWITWRTTSSVRGAWDTYRAECWEWFDAHRRLPLGTDWYEVHGEELRQLEPMTLLTLCMIEATDDDDRGKLVSVKTAREDLWRHLIEGMIVASGINPHGAVVQVPAHEWQYLELAGGERGTDFVIQRSASLEAAYSDLKFIRAAVVELWPEREGTAGWNAEVTSPPFDLSEPDWKLWDAAQWVGCEGRVLGSQEIADDDLDEKGAMTLFAAFYRNKLVATGLTKARIREPIPPVYWEMATIDPGLFRERHYVSFIDDVLKDYGGQFTPVGADQPRWFGIQVKRDDLFAAFPEFAPAPPDTGQSSPVKPAGHRTSRKLLATRLAIQAVWPDGVPEGLSDKERLAPINKWLVDNRHAAVSRTTIVRALRDKS